MTAEYTEYMTRENDAWDYIAWIHYDDPTAMGDIIRANPQIAILPFLPAGLRIAVPVRGDVRPALSNAQRPPWRQK